MTFSGTIYGSRLYMISDRLVFWLFWYLYYFIFQIFYLIFCCNWLLLARPTWMSGHVPTRDSLVSNKKCIVTKSKTTFYIYELWCWYTRLNIVPSKPYCTIFPKDFFPNFRLIIRNGINLRMLWQNFAKKAFCDLFDLIPVWLCNRNNKTLK